MQEGKMVKLLHSLGYPSCSVRDLINVNAVMQERLTGVP